MEERFERKNTEPFVSILTPVYNGEKYLAECIESVLEQTYDNWEYVIVNNCSTDRSLEIAKEYAKRDSRIRIHDNKEHLPVMANLNHTFRQMPPASVYCKVLHADDWMFPECLSKMVGLAETYPSVGIVNSYYLEDKTVGPYGLPYPSHVNDGREISRSFLLDNSNYFGAPSNLLIRSSLIQKRESVYDESYLQSDMSSCLDMLQESDFGFVHQVLTFTRRHKESLTNSVAKKHFTYMLGDLKIYLEYGPLFLTGKEFKEIMKKREEIFYIQFARNMFSLEMGVAYKRHSAELRSINYQVKHGKLIKNLIRETLLLILQKMGIKCSRNKKG